MYMYLITIIVSCKAVQCVHDVKFTRGWSVCSCFFLGGGGEF